MIHHFVRVDHILNVKKIGPPVFLTIYDRILGYTFPDWSRCKIREDKYDKEYHNSVTWCESETKF